MFDESQSDGARVRTDVIRDGGLPLSVVIPLDHVGPLVLPGSGRLIWWTGRVAIGLRHQPRQRGAATSPRSPWVQGP